MERLASTRRVKSAPEDSPDTDSQESSRSDPAVISTTTTDEKYPARRQWIDA